MNRHWKGVVALTAAFVIALIVALSLHSLVGVVTILLAMIAVAFVLGISWMRTAPIHRTRGKQGGLR